MRPVIGKQLVFRERDCELYGLEHLLVAHTCKDRDAVGRNVCLIADEYVYLLNYFIESFCFLRIVLIRLALFGEGLLQPDRIIFAAGLIRLAIPRQWRRSHRCHAQSARVEGDGPSLAHASEV